MSASRAERRTAAAPQWRLRLIVPARAVAAFEAALADGATALSSFEESAPGLWRIEALSDKPPERAGLERALAALAHGLGIPRPPLVIETLASRDWAREALGPRPPVRAGRYHIRSGADESPPPPGTHALVVDAGLAFGTGLHESTRGSLLALDRLAKRRRFRRPLDLGCGTGILAMAMARTWRVPVLAADIDPAALSVAEENVRRNGLARLVRVMASDGLGARALVRAAPFDLVAANILARPLVRLAPALWRHLDGNGRVVLSGFLAGQEAWVRGASVAQGFAMEERLRLGEWVSLVLRHP